MYPPRSQQLAPEHLSWGLFEKSVLRHQKEGSTGFPEIFRSFGSRGCRCWQWTKPSGFSRSTPGWFCVLSPPAAPRTCNVSPSGPSIHDVAAPIEQSSDVISWFPRCAGLYIKLIEKSRCDKNPYCERSRISCSLTGLWTLLKWKEGLRAPIVLGWNFGWWNPTRRIMKSPMKCNSSYSPTRKSERGQWYFFWFKLGCCCPIR